MIKQIICKVGSILTFILGTIILLENPLVAQVRMMFLSNALINILVVGGLFLLGFSLSKKCEK